MGCGFKSHGPHWRGVEFTFGKDIAADWAVFSIGTRVLPPPSLFSTCAEHQSRAPES